MTDEELIAMARLAQRDDRMSSGALYGDLADRIEALLAERDSAIRGRDDWRDDYKALAAAIVGDTGLSAMTVATQARMYRPRAEAAEAENARLREAVKEARDLAHSLAHDGYDGVWTQADFDGLTPKADAVLAAPKGDSHD